MATIQETVVAYVGTHPDYLAVAPAKPYPLVVPQRVTLPAVSYMRVSDPKFLTHDVVGALRRPRFQFTCWDDDLAGAQLLANTLKSVLHGRRLTGAGPALEDDQRDVYDPETGRVGVACDYFIWCYEDEL